MYQSEFNNATLRHVAEYLAIKEKASKFEPKGIFHSELLMVQTLLGLLHIGHIIESGRARGQSTEIVARMCLINDIKFDSIEYDHNSPDVQVAEERLKPFSKVCTLHYGDGFDVMPKLIKQDTNTLILVDGPKGVWGLKLGLSMLKNKNVLAVVFHDTHRDADDVRPILERYFKNNLIVSDDCEYVERFSHLDEDCWEITKSYTNNNYGPYVRGNKRMRSYAGTFCCVLNNENIAHDLSDCLDELNALIDRKNSLIYKVMIRMKLHALVQYCKNYFAQ